MHPPLSFRGPPKADRGNLIISSSRAKRGDPIYNNLMKQYYVYILSNFTRTVLYTGITNNLLRRVWQHKNNLVKGFTQKYQVHELLFYEVYYDPETAIEREKQIKSWNRAAKEKLISKFNPSLKDLYKNIN